MCTNTNSETLSSKDFKTYFIIRPNEEDFTLNNREQTF